MLTNNTMNLFRYRIGHLESFLNAEGEYCPEDIEDYAVNGAYEDQCPLCGIEHHLFTTKTFIGENGVEYDTHICRYCDPEIDAMVIKQRKFNYGGIAYTRLLKFKDEGLFPSDAIDFLIRPHECLFCLEHVDVNDVTKIPLPVGINDSNYHTVSCCPKCADMVMANWPNNLMHSDICNQCKHSYPITQEEYEARREGHTLNFHVCGECGLEYGLTEKVRRFRARECDGCKKSVYIDKSLIYEHNINIYSDGCLCEECIRKDSFEFQAAEDQRKMSMAVDKLNDIYGTSYTEHVIEDYYVVIHKGDVNYTFSIILMEDETKGYEVLFASPRRWEKPEDAMFVGYNAAYTVYENKQTKLEL